MEQKQWHLAEQSIAAAAKVLSDEAAQVSAAAAKLAAL
jgi:hypothetical protein